MTYEESVNKIKDLLDKEFLDKLVEIGKLYGWKGDYHEIVDFIEELHNYHGIGVGDMEPYKITE